MQLHSSLIGGIDIKKSGLTFLTFGIVPSDRIPYLLQTTSRSKVTNEKFIFAFNESENPNDSPYLVDRRFRGAKSPKEFILIKLKENDHRNYRKILKEKSSWRTRILAEIIPVLIEQIESALFLVQPTVKLPEGEYCFVHQDILNTSFFGDFAFFDFAIEK